MLTAHANFNGQDCEVARASNLAELMYEVTHGYGCMNDPEPCVIKENFRSTIGTVSFGHWTTDGRDCYFVFPNGARKLIKLSVSLEDTFDNSFIGNYFVN